MSAKTDELLRELIEVSGPLAKARLAGEYESALAAVAVAGLVVRPTTTAAITFWNGESPGGKSLVMDRIFTHNLVSTTAQAFFGLWYCIHRQMAEPTNDITTLRGTGDGVGPNVNTVFVDVAATVKNDGWFPAGIAGEAEEVGVLPGSIAEWEVQGRLIVPPGAGMSLQVVSGVVGDTFTSGASWWRTQLEAVK